MSARDWELEAKILLGPEAGILQLELAADAMKAGYAMGWEDFARRLSSQLAQDEDRDRAMLRRIPVPEDKP